MSKIGYVDAPTDYASGKTHPEYQCYRCGASGCKLWRDYQTFLNHQELLCVDCACAAQEKDAASVNEAGRLVDGRGIHCDQIGWLVPAVPTEDGSTLWGYTSVPQAGCDWWYGLPLRPRKESA